MRALLVLTVVISSACSSRTVTIAGDGVTVRVSTDSPMNVAEVHVEIARPPAIVPVIFIPSPVPYAAAPRLAEKPEK